MTSGAGLATRIVPITGHHGSAIPARFVFQLAPELAERRIMDRAGVHPPGHGFDVQIFDADDIVLSYEVGRQWVQRGLALIGYPGVDLRDAPFLLLAPFAAFHSTG